MNGLLLTPQAENKDIKSTVKKLLDTKEKINQKEIDFFQKTLENILEEENDEPNKTFLLSKLLDISQNKKIKSTFSNENLFDEKTPKISLIELINFVSILKNTSDDKLDLTSKKIKHITISQTAVSEFKNAQSIGELLNIAQKHGIKIKNFQFFSTQSALDQNSKKMIKKVKSEDIFKLIEKNGSSSHKTKYLFDEPQNNLINQKSSKNILESFLASKPINNSLAENKISKNDSIKPQKNNIKTSIEEKLETVAKDFSSLSKDQNSKIKPLKIQDIEQKPQSNTIDLQKSKTIKNKQTEHSSIKQETVIKTVKSEQPRSVSHINPNSTVQYQTKNHDIVIQSEPKMVKNEQIKHSSIKQETIVKSKQTKHSIDSLAKIIKNEQPKPLRSEINSTKQEQIQIENSKKSLENLTIVEKRDAVKEKDLSYLNNQIKTHDNEKFTKQNNPKNLQQPSHYEKISTKQTKSFVDESQLPIDLGKSTKPLSKTKESKEKSIPIAAKDSREIIDNKQNGIEIKQIKSHIQKNKTEQNQILDKSIQNSNIIKQTEISENSVTETEDNNDTQTISHQKQNIATEQKSGQIIHHKTSHQDFKRTFNTFAQEFKEKVENYKPPLMKIKMQLNPGNLGEVDVTLINRGNNLHVNINSNPNTIAIFSQNQTEFKNSLINMGFTSLQMNFGDSKDGQRGQNHKENSKNSKLFAQEHQENENFELIVPRYI